MLHLTSGVALVVEVGLAVFCFIDVLLAPEAAVRWLPRWAWALLLLVFPLCGVIGWLCAGRPWRAWARGPAGVRATPGTVSPDDVPPVVDLRDADDALAVPRPATGLPMIVPRSPEASLAEQLLLVHEEHERTLLAWESDLRRREAALAASRTSSAPKAPAES